MIDRHLMGPLGRLLSPPARMLASLGIRADQVTLAGFGIGLAAVPLIAFGAFKLALAAILMNRLLDGLDGAIARATLPTDRGAFLDIALDFFFYACVPFGFALYDPAANALPAAALILSFVGSGSSFLAVASVAAGRGLASREFAGKGIYFLGGLTEGFETILAFALMCLWPGAFVWFAWLFAALCLVTTLARWHRGWLMFSDR